MFFVIDRRVIKLLKTGCGFVVITTSGDITLQRLQYLIQTDVFSHKKEPKRSPKARI